MFRFCVIDFQLNADFPSQFNVFCRKIALALLKDRFLKKILFKKSKNPSAFLRKTIGQNDYFTLIGNNFRFLL